MSHVSGLSATLGLRSPIRKPDIGRSVPKAVLPGLFRILEYTNSPPRNEKTNIGKLVDGIRKDGSGFILLVMFPKEMMSHSMMDKVQSTRPTYIVAV